MGRRSGVGWWSGGCGWQEGVGTVYKTGGRWAVHGTGVAQAYRRLRRPHALWCHVFGMWRAVVNAPCRTGKLPL